MSYNDRQPEENFSQYGIPTSVYDVKHAIKVRPTPDPERTESDDDGQVVPDSQPDTYGQPSNATKPLSMAEYSSSDDEPIRKTAKQTKPRKMANQPKPDNEPICKKAKQPNPDDGPICKKAKQTNPDDCSTDDEPPITSRIIDLT